MTHALWSLLLAPALKALALCGSLAGLALGVLLLARPEPTTEWLRRMNRWVSSRRALKALEVPRALAGARRRRPWLGLILAAGGAYVVVALVWGFRAAPFAAAIGAGPLAAVVIDAVRWCLVAGSALAVAAGVLLVLSPGTFQRVEQWSDRWVSSRRALQGADTMHLPLDRFVERFPRAAGALILGFSAAAAVATVVVFQLR